MKRPSMQVLRLNTSSYLSSGFIAEEANKLQSLEGVHYLADQLNFNPLIPLTLITNTHTEIEKIPPTLLAATQLIIHPNSGYDNFPPSFVRQVNFPIILGNEIRAQAVCEYILAALFQATTPQSFSFHWNAERKWDQRRPLAGKKILIIGFGHIGKKMSKILANFTENISLYDPYQGKNIWPTIKSHSEKFDILILCCSANAKNFEMIDHSVFEILQEDFILINPARGTLIRETDMFDTLKKRPGARCYLDVFPQEPAILENYQNFPQLFLTSHIAGVFPQLSSSMINFECRVLEEFLYDPLLKNFEDSDLRKRLKGDFLI